MTTSYEDVRSMANEHNLIPVVRRLLADTETPIRVFRRFHQAKHAFLLESVEGGERWSRYSFIGTDPFMLLQGKQGNLHVQEGNKRTVIRENPLEALKLKMKQYKSPAIDALPRFTGGAVGFFGYDLLQYFEKLPAHRCDDLQMSDLNFMFCDRIIAFDHLQQQIVLIANAHIPEQAEEMELHKAYTDAVAALDEMMQQCTTASGTEDQWLEAVPDELELGEITSNVLPETFMENVLKAKAYIEAGDIFQVVLSQRFEMTTTATPFEVYRVLRRLNPSPYMYYLKMDEEIMVGTSPELLVRVEGQHAVNRPLAGTRPRGKTPEEDLAYEQDLLSDEKELAEHRMLVDLGRNDLGRVCEYGTVECDTFMGIERYSHVMHIYSNVVGKMRQDRDFYDALISCMPAGTVSGAPKLRAMEIIAELENEARGAYAGAIGYLGFSGNLDTCITIRTVIFKGQKAYVQAGAGIVADSVPQKEYDETKNKAMALLKSIRMAEKVFHPVANK